MELGEHGMITRDRMQRFFRLESRSVPEGAEQDRIETSNREFSWSTGPDSTSNGSRRPSSAPAAGERRRLSSDGTTHDRRTVAVSPALHVAVADAVEQERRRIAAEVHDLIMQDLSLALSRARLLG